MKHKSQKEFRLGLVHKMFIGAVAALAGLCVGRPLTGLADTNTVATNSVESTNQVQSATNSPPHGTSDHGGLGVGVILGEPTGLSMKYWLSKASAVDLGAAWSLEDTGSFQIHSDYLYHKFDLFPIDNGELPLYFGVGARVKVPDHGDTRFGIRIPVGIAYEFHDVPIEIFAEVAPIVDVVPATQLKWNGGVGARFYFR